MNELLRQAWALETELVEFRRELHQFPELSFEETETADKVAQRLRQLGLSVRTGVGGCGVVADLPGDGGPGPLIALRADMVQQQMAERLTRIVERTAEAYRCRATLRYIEQTLVLAGSDDCVDYVAGTIDRLLGPQQRLEAAPTMAGEDFSVYLQHVPGCFFWLGSGPEEHAGQAFGLHHPRFTLNEACLPVGAALLAAIALNASTGEWVTGIMRNKGAIKE
ncbi:MAG: amidohydrolase [Paenibacillus sp.]|jgi:metal-dependent amidase/aminoacylase/carboxypeptidase family protein|nr:amidohydrolase [Paenibacillus sp.]